MRLLALDLGATLGWADAGGQGEVELPGARPERLAELAMWLYGKIGGLGLGGRPAYDAVVYERPFCRGMAATRSLWGAAGVVEAMAHWQGLAVIDVEVNTVKRHARVRGAEKPLDFAKKYRGDVTGGHEADAVALYLYATENVEVSDG